MSNENLICIAIGALLVVATLVFMEAIRFRELRRMMNRFERLEDTFYKTWQCEIDALKGLFECIKGLRRQIDEDEKKIIEIYKNTKRDSE